MGCSCDGPKCTRKRCTEAEVSCLQLIPAEASCLNVGCLQSWLAIFFFFNLGLLNHWQTIVATSRPAEDAPVGADDRFVFLRRLVREQGPQDVKVPAGSSEKKIVNFSLESVLQFKDDHFEHAAHGKSEGIKPLGSRPNYDHRKRQFWAIQQPERKQYLKIR